MWDLYSDLFAYIAVGCTAAFISLITNWKKSDQLRPQLFIIGHVFWPITLFIAFVYAMSASDPD